MIRINLLAVERERTKTRVVIPAAHRVTIAAALILVGTLALVGWWFLSLRSQSAQLDADIARAELETQQLRSVLAQVQKFESRKAQLQQRVSLIEQLRKGQSVPVHIVDRLSRSLPDRLWLTQMAQNGNEFSFTGYTDQITSVSDFIANLEATTLFKKPVEIVDTQMAQDPRAGDLVRFQLKATYHDPSAQPAAKTAAAAR
jgi:type IV pilus assembly protein PilN